MTNVKVGEKVMAGDNKWVSLDIGVLATTTISHAIPPEYALKLGEALIKKAKELQDHNQRLEDEKWENRGGMPDWDYSPPVEAYGG